MKHQSFPPASVLLPLNGGRSAALDRNARLCTAILAQGRVIDREIEQILRSRLEFEILLDLYVAEHQGAAPCLWDIGSATPLPSSTVHRKITNMIRRGVLVRLPQSGDRRRVAVQLSVEAKALVERTLEHLTVLAR